MSDLLSVVLVNWNSKDDLRACLTSLTQQTYSELEVIIVDNGSQDGSCEMVVEEFPQYRLLPQGENLGFAEGCNRGIEASHGPWVAMLNNDTVAEPRWAEALMREAARCPEHVGMLQSLMVFRERPGVINSTGIELTSTGGGRDRQEGKTRDQAGSEVNDIFCPTAGAAAYRRSMLDAIRIADGYFDRTHFMYYEDMDLGWRAQLAGYEARFVPDSCVAHAYHASTKRRGREWLLVITRTNCVRTMLKNASVGLIARTAPRRIQDIVEVVWYSRGKGVKPLIEAIKDSIEKRHVLTRRSVRERTEIERKWVRV